MSARVCTSCGDLLRAQRGLYVPADKCPECAWELRTGQVPPPVWPEDQEPMRLRRAPARQRLGRAVEEPSPWEENAVRALEDAHAE